MASMFLLCIHTPACVPTYEHEPKLLPSLIIKQWSSVSTNKIRCVPDELSLQRLPLVVSPLVSLATFHGHPSPFWCLGSAAHWHEVIVQGLPCLSLAQFPLSWKASCTLRILKTFEERHPSRCINYMPKSVLSGMNKRHPIVWAAVKQKVQLTVLADLTPDFVSVGYLTHLITHLVLLYTLLHGTRVYTGEGFAGLESVSYCPVLNLTLSYLCVLALLPFSFSFQLISH